MISLEGIVVIVGWFTSLFVAVIIVPRIAARRVCEQFGLTMVVQGGRKFYVPTDPSGDPIQVPIGTKEVDGETKAIMGFAPLAYTMPILAAEYAAQKVGMRITQAKGNISRKLSAEALKAGMTEDLIGFLPKKVQGAIAIARAFGLGNPSQEGTAQGQTAYRPGNGGFKPGL